MRLFEDFWYWLDWGWRRPWHLIFGHDPRCVSFLAGELLYPHPMYPVEEHRCCECGLFIHIDVERLA